MRGEAGGGTGRGEMHPGPWRGWDKEVSCGVVCIQGLTQAPSLAAPCPPLRAPCWVRPSQHSGKAEGSGIGLTDSRQSLAWTMNPVCLAREARGWPRREPGGGQRHQDIAGQQEVGSQGACASLEATEPSEAAACALRTRGKVEAQQARAEELLVQRPCGREEGLGKTTGRLREALEGSEGQGTVDVEAGACELSSVRGGLLVTGYWRDLVGARWGSW